MIFLSHYCLICWKYFLSPLAPQFQNKLHSNKNLQIFALDTVDLDPGGPTAISNSGAAIATYQKASAKSVAM